MSELRAELHAIVEALASEAGETGEVSLDTIGDAIGARAVDYTEIEAMIAGLEARGLRVTGANVGRGEAHLATVIASARALGVQLGRRPNPTEIAEHAGLSLEQVRHALALVRVMQR